jgi:hypothetical protein
MSFGCKVTAQWHKSNETLQKIKENSDGDLMFEVQADCSSETDVEKSFQAAIDKFGPISVW